jgi:hypothetical protein
VVTNPDGAGTLGSILDWTATAIAANATKTYTVTFKVGAHTNAWAVIAVAAASLQTPDPTYANNAATTTITLGNAKAQDSRLHHARDLLALGRRLVARLRALDRRTHHHHS